MSDSNNTNNNDNNNNSTTSIMPSSMNNTNGHTLIRPRRVFMSMTIPFFGTINMETEYDFIHSLAPDNTNNNDNNNNNENTSSNDNNHPNRSDRLSMNEFLPMMMLMNSLAGSLVGNSARFIHPAFSNLTAEQLAEFLNGGGNKAKPAASSEVVECLPRIKMQLNSDQTCTVCQCEFEAAETAVRLPCQHLYHEDCILPWFKEKNSCPTCRYELLTDDEEYNNTVVLKQAAPVKLQETTPTITPMNTEKDGDVVMESNENSSGNLNKPNEVEFVVEELKRQISAAKQTQFNNNEVHEGSRNDQNTTTNNITISEPSSPNRLANKRKREDQVEYATQSVTIEDITGREEDEE